MLLANLDIDVMIGRTRQAKIIAFWTLRTAACTVDL